MDMNKNLTTILLLTLFSMPALAYTTATTTAHWCLVDSKGVVAKDCTAPAFTSENINYFKPFYPSQKTYSHGWNKQKRVVPGICFGTSNTPSGFINSADATALNYNTHNAILFHWGDVSKVVYFGGSASEGQLLLPSPGWIHLAHENGATIYGTIFFSPDVYGGDKETQQLKYLLTQTKTGTYPVADELLTLAKNYDLDGFFINEEASYPSSYDASSFVPFIEYFNQQAKANHINAHIEWYTVANNDLTSVLIDGNKTIAHSTFVDFGLWGDGWITQPVQDALSQGYSNAQTEMGILASSYGLSDAANLNNSADIYAFQNILNGSASLATQIQNANSFWQTAESSYAPTNTHQYAQTPFETNFNMGAGNTYYINGTDMKTGYWNAVGLQDPVPTFSSLDQIDLTNAFNGGSSLEITQSANTNGSSQTLYNNLNTVTAKNDVLTVVYQKQTEQAILSVCVQAENPVCLALQNPDKIMNGWSVKSMTLPENTYHKLFIKTSATRDHAMNDHIGEIYIGNKANETTAPSKPKNVTTINTQVDPNNSNYTHQTLRWQPVNNAKGYFVFVNQQLKSVSFQPIADIAINNTTKNPIISVVAFNKFGVVSRNSSPLLKNIGIYTSRQISRIIPFPPLKKEG